MATATLLTIAEFERLPEEEGVLRDLDEGELIRITLPAPRHSVLAGKIYRLLSEFVEKHSLGAVFPSDTGYVLSRNPDTLRGPDVSFLRDERAAAVDLDRHIEGAPDLAVEVVSPSDSAQSLNKKVKQYLAAGCRTVWIVYPLTAQIEVFEADGAVRKLAADQTLEAPDLLPGFATRVSALFQD